MHDALLDAFQSQRGNQGGTHTTAVLSSQDLDGILLLRVLLLGPVENLTERLGTAGLEVRVFVKHGPVGAHMARLVSLLDADGSDAARRETSCPGANQLSKAADESQLRTAGLDVQLGFEEVERLLEVLMRIPTPY